MAHSEILCAGNAFSRVAPVRTRVLPCDRPSLLAARRSTVGKRISPGSLDDLVPLFCHVTVRHPVRISCLFRSRGLPDVLFVVTSVRFFSSGRSAVRSRIDVDMRHHRLPRSRGDLNHASFFASRSFSGRSRATNVPRNSNWPWSFTEPGGALNVATEPILTAFDLPVAKRGLFWDSKIWFDYFALTKPEVNFLIMFTTFAGFYLGFPSAWHDFPFLRSVNAVLGTLLVASGTGALNQYIERRFDAQMRRTARRPLAAGRLNPSA